MTSTIIVVPCYNEADRLQCDQFLQFLDAHPDITFLFVDDGSKDSTAEVLHSIEARNSRQVLVKIMPQNGGKASAVRAGYLEAFTHHPESIGFWDADLATPLEAIPDFISILKRRPDLETVIGSRLRLSGHRIERSRIRGRLGTLFASVASRLLRIRLNDTQCGAKLMRNTETIQRCFTDPFLAKWIFDVEIFARMRSLLREASSRSTDTNALGIYEHPLEQWTEIAGSKVRGRDFVTAFRELIRIYLRYLRPFAADYAPELPAASGADSHLVFPLPNEQEEQRRAA